MSTWNPSSQEAEAGDQNSKVILSYGEGQELGKKREGGDGGKERNTILKRKRSLKSVFLGEWTQMLGFIAVYEPHEMFGLYLRER